MSRVGVVVVSYESPTELLHRCLASAVASIDSTTGNRVNPEIVLVDNASASKPTVPDGVTLLMRSTNLGFAAGVNVGIAALGPSVDTVFLLNPDAVLAPDALARCLDRLHASPATTVAVAPKMVLADDGTAGPATTASTIDAIGIGVNAKAEAANRGLGQPDLGQYDRSEPVFGACFGAALIRRSAFDSGMVGPVDEHLFLYYEDVAWCWSAQLLGLDIVTEPAAVVTHVMSAGVVRERPYDFKFRYTEQNLLLCALMYFEPMHAIRVVTRRKLGLLRGSLLGRHYPKAGLLALFGVARQLPHVFATRRRITARRVRTDAEIVAYRNDEPIFFDSVNYRVSDPLAAEAFAKARLTKTTGTTASS